MKTFMKEYWLQTCVGKTFLSTTFYKKKVAFKKKNFFKVADTHTSVCANSQDTMQEYFFLLPFLPLFELLRAQGFRQV